MTRHDTLRRKADAKALSYVGNKYSRLTVIDPGEGRSGGRRFGCICECGNVAKVRLAELLLGKTKSCGCWDREATSLRAKTHGLSKTPEYVIWKAMHQRCKNPKNKKYRDYGGRGIAICKRWHAFENFIADMGHRPPKHSIDRIDNNGNYEPGNCRWATSIEQRQNQRRSISGAASASA